MIILLLFYDDHLTPASYMAIGNAARLFWLCNLCKFLNFTFSSLLRRRPTHSMRLLGSVCVCVLCSVSAYHSQLVIKRISNFVWSIIIHLDFRPRLRFTLKLLASRLRTVQFNNKYIHINNNQRPVHDARLFHFSDERE